MLAMPLKASEIVSRTVYAANKGLPAATGTPTHLIEDANDAQIAREWGWTLEYIRNLSAADYMIICGILDGEARARKGGKK